MLNLYLDKGCPGDERSVSSGTFCAVARFGSLNAAARHLGLSSASVGEQIKALEKDLNARLVSRNGRGMVPREAGHAVLPAARDVVERIEEMSQIAQLGEARGRLRVGAVSTATIGVLPRRSSAWRATTRTSN